MRLKSTLNTAEMRLSSKLSVIFAAIGAAAKKVVSATPIFMVLTNRRRLVMLGLAALLASAAALSVSWNGSKASAQTVACSIRQLTSGQSSTANINAAISDNGSQIALAVARNPTGGNADPNPEFFFYDTGTATITQVANTTPDVPPLSGRQCSPRISGDGDCRPEFDLWVKGTPGGFAFKETKKISTGQITVTIHEDVVNVQRTSLLDSLF